MPRPESSTAPRFHPACDLFPAMSADEFAALVADIREHGVREPITTLGGAILDGRHRWRACEQIGIDCPRREWSGPDSPLSYVVSTNLRRRHLDAGQRAALTVDLLPLLEAEALERKAAAGQAFGRGRPGKDPAIVPEAIRGESREQAASIVGVSARYVSDAKRLATVAPDLFDAVRAGTTTLPAAVRESGRRVAAERLDAVEVKQAKAAAGLYDVIVLDPPWPIEKIERDVRPNQGAMDYPTMTEGQIRELSLPMADDCHVWLWTTHRFLPLALSLLVGWGLRYVCTFVWHKPGGFQPVGLPQLNCEFALYARRGSPLFLDTRALPVCFGAPRGAHSEKPAAFYDVVRRVTGGRRLDMFNRRAIDGFDGWGKEASDGK